MPKYRIVQFKGGKYGIQKKHFWGLIWSLVGKDHVHNDGMNSTWYVLTFESAALAYDHIEEMTKIHNEYKITRIFKNA